QLARSAGSGIQLVGKDEQYAVLRLPSGEMRRVLLTCRATIGQVGNVDHENVSGGKAGRSRWLGKRPTVRGSAMNPVDHPHGGGEGKSKGVRHPVTPWGVPTLGKRTRKKHKESNNLIVRGRRRGKDKREMSRSSPTWSATRSRSTTGASTCRCSSRSRWSGTSSASSPRRGTSAATPATR